jgi:hypothetical protein
MPWANRTHAPIQKWAIATASGRHVLRTLQGFLVIIKRFNRILPKKLPNPWILRNFTKILLKNLFYQISIKIVEILPKVIKYTEYGHTAVTREHFTCEQAYSGKEIRCVNVQPRPHTKALGTRLVNVLHSSRKNKITIFSSKTVFFIESFCTKLGRILKNKIWGRGLLSGRAGTLNK